MGAEGVLCEWNTRSSTLTRTVEPLFWQALQAQYGGGHADAHALSPEEKKLQEKIPYDHVLYWGKEAKIALGVAYVGSGLFNDDGSVFVDARFALGLDGIKVTGSSHTLEGAKAPNDLAISPSGTYVFECVGGACPGSDGRVWEAASGRVVRRFGKHEATRAVFWSEAGITEVGERGTAFAWGPGGFVPRPLGLEHAYVVQGGPRALAVRSNASGIEAAFVEPHGAVFSLPAPADAFVALPVGRASLLAEGPWAISGDGRRLAGAGGGFVGIWDLEARAFLRRLAYPDPSAATSSPWKMALSPDGKELAVLLYNRLYRWNVDSGASIAIPASGTYLGILYSPVTSELLARREGSTLEFWGKDATPRASRSLEKADGDLLASAEGRLVLVGTEDGLLVLDETQKTSEHFARGGDAVALSPNGEYLAVARFDGSIHILRASDGSERATVFPLPDDGGAVVQDDHGEVELLPDGPKTRAMLKCHVTNCLLPHEACEERLVTRGLWSSILEEGGTRGSPQLVRPHP